MPLQKRRIEDAVENRYQFLKITVADEVAEVCIDRPQRLNTLDSAAHAEMERVWPDLQERDDVAGVVLCGADGVFSAGGDVKDMLAHDVKVTEPDPKPWVELVQPVWVKWAPIVGQQAIDAVVATK